MRGPDILLFLGEVAQVQIKAKTYFGARHGLETLSQLISYDEIRQKLQMHKNASIVDKPAYVHRGLLIDTSRNFYRYIYLLQLRITLEKTPETFIVQETDIDN